MRSMLTFLKNGLKNNIMVGLYIAILCLGLVMAVWGGYCVIKQNKYHFYGAIVGCVR